jgi:hypothetical protein
VLDVCGARSGVNDDVDDDVDHAADGGLRRRIVSPEALV